MINPTGIKLWGTATNMATSPVPECPRQDADFQKPFNFIKQDGCVLDNNTGLTWEVKTPQNMEDAFFYADTEKYAAQVNTAKLGGYADWRLPTIKELEGISDFSQMGPAIDSNYFPNTSIKFFWTSTPSAVASDYAWVVSGYTGQAMFLAKDRPNMVVRLVRGTSSVYAFDITTVPGTAIDTSTNLMWQRFYVGQTWDGNTCNGIRLACDWQSALQQSVSTIFTGFTDWRVPNIKELRSLVDERYCYPNASINAAVFPGVSVEDIVWSSTPSTQGAGWSWVVGFNYGAEGTGMSRDGRICVRLVRDVAPPVPVRDYTEEEVRGWARSVYIDLSLVSPSTIEQWTHGSMGGPKAFYPAVKRVIDDLCNQLSAGLP